MRRQHREGHPELRHVAVSLQGRRIELEEALTNADSRTNLEAKINFG